MFLGVCPASCFRFSLLSVSSKSLHFLHRIKPCLSLVAYTGAYRAKRITVVLVDEAFTLKFTFFEGTAPGLARKYGPGKKVEE